MKEGKRKKQVKRLPSGDVREAVRRLLKCSRVLNMRGKRDTESVFDGT